MSKAPTESKQISTKLAVGELATIDQLVKKGLYMSRSDFTRQAIREKVKKHQPIEKSGV